MDKETYSDLEKILNTLDKINEAFYTVKTEFGKICKSSNSVKDLDYMRRRIDMRIRTFYEMKSDFDFAYEYEHARIFEENNAGEKDGE